MSRISNLLARFIERRPWWFIVIFILLSAAAIPGIFMLETETGFNAFVSPEAKISRDNARYQAQFGGDPITVLLTGQLDDIFSPDSLAIMSEFELQLSADDRFLAIDGPQTLVHAAVEETEIVREAFIENVIAAQEEAGEKARQKAADIGYDRTQQEQAAEMAKAEVWEEFKSQLETMMPFGEPAIDNLDFISYLLYDEQGNISELMQPFVPDDIHALIVVTPQGNMSDDEMLEAAEVIEDFFHEQPLEGVAVTVVSSSKLVNAISTSMGNNIATLLILSVIVMIIILLLMFRVRWRLLSLFMVGISALWTFGIMGYFSVPLTMATMAVLPILIGLGIDFSIQFQNRYQEEITRSKTVGEAIITAITHMFPVVGIALIATIIGFITLYISEVPMIREFGMMLAVGIVISYLTGLFLLYSIIYLADKRVDIKKLTKESTKASGRIERVLLRMGRLAINHTLWIFIVSVVFAVGGGIVDHWLPTNTDYEELMPQKTPELVEIRELRSITGSGGTLRFMVESPDATSPETLVWLKSYQEEALAQYPELISVNSLATIVDDAAGGVIPAPEQIDAIIENTAPNYLRKVLSDDHQMLSVLFGIKYIPLDRTHDILQQLAANAEPPSGTTFSPVGSLALGVSTVDAIVGSRMTLNIICLSAVFVVLLLVYRRLGNTIFTVIPVGAVIAWSSLDMYLIGIPLNPLTAILGVLIIGICTEFMVLLMGRYEEEKRLGLPPAEAMATAISKIGRAIVTTALTTLGGFGVLIASNFIMVRDFGIATVVGVFLCLVISMTVMPGLIVWYDNWRRKRAARQT